MNADEIAIRVAIVAAAFVFGAMLGKTVRFSSDRSFMVGGLVGMTLALAYVLLAPVETDVPARNPNGTHQPMASDPR